ncbi:MAG: RtcB family protein [Gemmatimonadota bacterium]|nr:RtcB family protein [Gemmatimonadota bacterium]MDH4349863.1 RtcB family protein [Gemmatimonadota bacterium]MDH5196278.1 RtcB family protein [Gemmatimonadota bacterium]
MTKASRTYASTRLDHQLVEIPASARNDMRVAARVFADDYLWDQIRRDRTIDQLVNVATLPGIETPALAMPDAHEGYGFPVGGVAAFRAGDGVISPGGVGYDINCGVRLLASGVPMTVVRPHLAALMHELSRRVPSGAGRGGHLSLERDALDGVLARGCRALLDRELATPDDLAHTEAGGALPDANSDAVSDRAKHRGHDQLGTLGSGNHFVEIQQVETVLDSAAGTAMGLREGDCVVLVHTGSRGLGHQVCTDYVRAMDAVMRREAIHLPDRELACAPFRSPEGQRYFGAMCAAANFAFANRQAITHAIRAAFGAVVGGDVTLRLVYDVAHNMAKLETHGARQLVVHRKGATRAFGPSHPETPARYRTMGQPVLIPGSMGTASYVLVGTDEALDRSFGSCCHGAGRAMSRHAARAAQPGQAVRQSLANRGILVTGAGNRELAEEAPQAYKDVDRVVDVVHAARLARKVARLVPVGVLKG